MLLDAKDVEHTELNDAVRRCGGECRIINCLGQRFIGGRAGAFLGAYQAGGVIVVLGLHTDGKKIVHNFPCTGMHGGKLFLRGKCDDIEFPSQVTARAADSADLKKIQEYVNEICEKFGCSSQEILNSPFTVVTPNSKNPYKQMYVAN